MLLRSLKQRIGDIKKSLAMPERAGKKYETLLGKPDAAIRLLRIAVL